MASSSGTITTTSSGVSDQGSEEDLQVLLDQKKRKRMISNRESAQRSRKRKQKQLEDLTSLVSQLSKENKDIISSISITTQQFMGVEAENRVLRAQMAELTKYLQSLKETIALMYQQPVDGAAVTGGGFDYGGGAEFADELIMNNSLSYLYASLPILASSDMMLY